MREVRDAMAAILERTTLATVCRTMDQAQQKQERARGALLYEI
jgi:DNA-binding IscR family transcriptional regulator